jgi:Enolase C-terminal domain-like
VRITGLDALDIRFPTSRARNGSDAMNPDPDYSAAYALIRTDDGPDGPRVHVHDRQGQRTRRHPRKRSRCSARRSTAADAAQAALLREEIRPEPRLSLDANQVWDVGQAIAAIGELSRFDPHWIEEPTRGPRASPSTASPPGRRGVHDPAQRTTLGRTQLAVTRAASAAPRSAASSRRSRRRARRRRSSASGSRACAPSTRRRSTATGSRGAGSAPSYDATLRSVEESLERLGLDRIDVLHVHDPDDHYEQARDGAYPGARAAARRAGDRRRRRRHEQGRAARPLRA